MLCIWKKSYEIESILNTRFEVSMPNGAEVLHIDQQYGTISMWFKTETTNAPEVRTFCCYGTGIEMVGGVMLKHLGTVLTHGGTLVLHFFEEIPHD